MAKHITIVGAGFSGLSLALQLLEHGPQDVHISMVDPHFDSAPSRTWCFWGEVPNLLRPYVSMTWGEMAVCGPTGHGEHQTLGRNPYHLVEGTRFASGALARLRADGRLTLVRAKALRISDEAAGARVETTAGTLDCDFAFASHRHPLFEPHLLQHFGGWEVETEDAVFSEGQVTLMDFDCPQSSATSFFYVLPLTRHRALVEYTQISKHPNPRTVYDQAIEAYLQRRTPSAVRILRREYGMIPMDARPLPQREGKNVFRIGHSGGMTKPTTGYTVARSVRQAFHFAKTLARHGHPEPLPAAPARFRFYDRVFLQVLKKRPELGPHVFTRLLLKNRMDDVLDFLDEKTSLATEAKLLRHLPWIPFLQEALPPSKHPLLPVSTENPRARKALPEPDLMAARGFGPPTRPTRDCSSRSSKDGLPGRDIRTVGLRNPGLQAPS